MTDPNQFQHPQHPQQVPPQQVPPQQGYGPPAAPYPGYQPGPPQYEFSEVENKTIERCSAWAKAIAVLFFLNATLQVINFNIIGIAINVGIGIAFWKGHKSLAAVVETQGSDITHLMDALKSITNAFMIRLIIMAVGVGILLLVGIIFGIIYLT